MSVQGQGYGEIDETEGNQPYARKEPSIRAEAQKVLEDAAKTIGAGGDRHRDYGSALDNFTDIGKLWAVLFGVEEITAEQVASAMALVKLARLKHSPNHRDSFVDAIGYVALGADIAATPGRYV